VATASVISTQPTPDEALQRLVDGNEAFVADAPVPADLSRERRLALAEGQQPFATLVGCSDSRVGPEQLFGAGLGELFIVRTEPPRVCRRLFGLSYAAMGTSSSIA
jgi:carbonic anhydrase